jgi:hypothetical protein
MKRIPAVLIALVCLLASLEVAPHRDAWGASFAGDGGITGHVVLIPGVAASSCTVVVQGAAAQTGRCNSDGYFTVRGVPGGGTYDVDITVDGPHAGLGIPVRHAKAVVHRDEDMDMGEIVVGKPGAISGVVDLSREANISDADYDHAVVGIPELGLYTQLGLSHQFLISGVAPGRYNVQLFINRRIFHGTITIQASITNGGLMTGIQLPRVPIGTGTPL